MIYNWAADPSLPKADVYDAAGVQHRSLAWINTETGDGEQWTAGRLVPIKLRAPVRVELHSPAKGGQ